MTGSLLDERADSGARTSGARSRRPSCVRCRASGPVGPPAPRRAPRAPPGRRRAARRRSRHAGSAGTPRRTVRRCVPPASKRRAPDPGRAGRSSPPTAEGRRRWARGPGPTRGRGAGSRTACGSPARRCMRRPWRARSRRAPGTAIRTPELVLDLLRAVMSSITPCQHTTSPSSSRTGREVSRTQTTPPSGRTSRYSSAKALPSSTAAVHDSPTRSTSSGCIDRIHSHGSTR